MPTPTPPPNTVSPAVPMEWVCEVSVTRSECAVTAWYMNPADGDRIASGVIFGLAIVIALLAFLVSMKIGDRSS